MAESRKVVEDATDWAEAQPDPDPATAQRHVYADDAAGAHGRSAVDRRAVHRRWRAVGRSAARWRRLMAVMTYIESVRDTLAEEMRRDDSIVVLGEDVGKKGGVFLATDGLYDEFGGDRVLDTPLDRVDDRGRLDRRRPSPACGRSRRSSSPTSSSRRSTRSCPRRRACASAPTAPSSCPMTCARRMAAASMARCTTRSRSRRSSPTSPA